MRGTLLAAYHLFGSPERVAGTPFVKELASRLGRSQFPKASVVVLEGGALGAGEPDHAVNGARTLLGHLAYRLGGAEAYAKVADQDRNLRGSSTTQLVELLEAHTPCVILLDEMLQFLAKALNVRSHEGSLAVTSLTFIKELCTAVSTVPQSAVVATLTSSNLEDYASASGEEMHERLSKVVGRTENIITPVEGDDIFPILHRRLFTTVGPAEERRKVADAYADWYESLADAVPAAYREAGYRERLALAFPFHPELVDILTNRWRSLSGFQRTRGALRTLAHTVKALSQHQHKAPLIHSGDMMLADTGIRNEVLRFAGESYKSALNADIIRPESIAPEADRRRGGQVEEFHLATGLATTAFLNSFGSDRVLGASAAQMLLGVGRPGLSHGLIQDVRDALEASLWYMRLEGGRYRFTTEPNLNKVVLEREGAIGDDRIETLPKEGLDDGGLAASVEQVGVTLRWALPTEDRADPGHVGTIVSVAASGDLLVSGGEDGLVRIWDLSRRRLVRSLRGHTGWVHAVAISPDGATIASAGEYNVILLWSAADGTQVGMLAGHEKRIRALVFRRHAAELISGAEDGLVRAWDLRTLTLARQASTRGAGIWSVSLPDDETVVAASGEDEYVRLFDLTTGELLDEAALHRAWVRSVRFLSGGHELVSASADGTARIWDASARRLEPRSVLDAAGERLRAVAYHDRQIVTAGEDATVRTQGDDAAQVRMPAGINWVRTIASTGRGVAVGCEDGSLRLWDPRARDSHHVIALGRNTTWSAAFADDGRRLALGRADGTVRLHEVADGTETSVLAAGTGRVWALASAGPYVSAACGDGRLRVWRGTEPLLELNRDVLLTWAVAISEDGRHLTASDTNGHVRVWSLPDGTLQWDQDAKAGRVRSLAVSARTNTVAAAGGDGVVRTWDLSTGDGRATVSVPGWARAVALGHQGSRIAVGAGTGDIYLYVDASAEPSVTLAGHRGRVLMLGFAADDASLVSAAADGTARRWTLDGRGGSAQVRVDASAQCAAYDPSTGHAAVASAAGTLLLRVADPG